MSALRTAPPAQAERAVPSSRRVLDLAPPLMVVAAVVWLVASGAGYETTRWGPVAMAALALLALRLALDPAGPRAAPRAAVVAVVLMAAYAAWAGLSLLWARDAGLAWTGADRVLLYVALFAVIALWPLAPRDALLVLGAWTAAMLALALVDVLRLLAASDPSSWFLGDRLARPAGYPNAAAAMWSMALWPALVLAGRRELAPPLRAGFAGGAVLLCDLALLSQSRGSAIAVPLTALLALALVPGRLRTFWTLALIAAAVAATAVPVLHVGAVIRAGGSSGPALHAALRWSLASAAVVAALVAVAAAAGRARALPPSLRLHGRRLAAAAAVAIALAAVVAALVRVGDPAAFASKEWRSFRAGYAEHVSGSRLSMGLGSNRYDFYRVALGIAGRHPLNGIGADNFGAQYLVLGRSAETPRYTHSIELSVLVGTGAIGAGLLAAALAAAGIAIVRSRRERTAGAVAAGAALVFAYWALHGSADWFWEIAGLGAGAWAMLGLACAAAGGGARRAPPEGPRRSLALPAIAAGLAIAAVVPPWLAQAEARRAAAVFGADPARAIALLRRAAAVDTLDAAPLLLEGTARERLGDLAGARRAFAAAEARAPDAYAALQLGAIASAQGRRVEALLLLRRALALAPRDPVAREALAVVRAGRTVDLPRLNAAIAAAGRRFAGP